MDKEFKKEFKKCPACGSENRFFESLAKELKERGIARKEWNFALDSKQGVVTDPQMVAGVPIGSELPGWSFETDICSECGTVYATKLERLKAHRSFEPSPHRKTILPNLKQNN